jgi:four helix bundle protein
MVNIRSFKELKVWQKAMDAAMRVFDLTRSFPVEERYSLSDQLRRASRSVPANIAEAWRKRRYPAAFVSKLNDAEGEAAECQTWIELARRCDYLTKEDAMELDGTYEQILAQLVTMAEHADDWTVGTRRQKMPGQRRGCVRPDKDAPA